MALGIVVAEVVLDHARRQSGRGVQLKEFKEEADQAHSPACSSGGVEGGFSSDISAEIEKREGS